MPRMKVRSQTETPQSLDQDKSILNTNIFNIIHGGLDLAIIILHN